MVFQATNSDILDHINLYQPPILYSRSPLGQCEDNYFGPAVDFDIRLPSYNLHPNLL